MSASEAASASSNAVATEKTPCADAEVSDLTTLDYNARPTLVPRTSTLDSSVLTVYGAIYLGLASMWIPVQRCGIFNCCRQSHCIFYPQLGSKLLTAQSNSSGGKRHSACDGATCLFNHITAPVIPWSSIVRADFEQRFTFRRVG